MKVNDVIEEGEVGLQVKLCKYAPYLKVEYGTPPKVLITDQSELQQQ